VSLPFCPNFPFIALTLLSGTCHILAWQIWHYWHKSRHQMSDTFSHGKCGPGEYGFSR